MCVKEKRVLEYMTPSMPHLNGVIKRIFLFVKEGALAMILNKNLNDTYQKMLWAETVHTLDNP